MTDAILSALQQTELLQPLSPEEVGRLAEVGRVEYWQQDALVLEEGTIGPRMMVILDGQVEVLRRDDGGVQRAIARLGPGDVLGEMSLLLDLPRTATVRALSELKVFAMDRQAFLEMVALSDPSVLKLGLELSRVLAKRLTVLNDKVLELLRENEDVRERFGEARQEVFHLWEAD
jgi:CRP/FNR family cyclic AMP-dependent transcriptional regulator